MRREMGLGGWPDVSLAQARAECGADAGALTSPDLSEMAATT
jgi:hypothetical protein